MPRRRSRKAARRAVAKARRGAPKRLKVMDVQPSRGLGKGRQPKTPRVSLTATRLG